MANAVKSVLGVIGGSGVYNINGLKVVNTHDIETPFGKPSDPVIEGDLDGRKIFFIARHGQGHRFLPSEVPYRANIYALKMLGVTHVVAVSAVGIMKEEIKPGNMVIPDQIFDRTKGVRSSSFFGEGAAGHVEFADPFCLQMRAEIKKATQTANAPFFDGGTYICMEGPQFSTRAESNFYRNTIGPSVIGMTALPEAKLAREAEMCYGMLALATDYDCWNEKEEDVSVEAVIAVLKTNSATANNIVKYLCNGLPETTSCKCHSAAQFATMTPAHMIPEKTKERLNILYGKYWG